MNVHYFPNAPRTSLFSVWHVFFFCIIESASLQKHIDDMVVLYCICVEERGGLGVLPQNFVVLNGVKSCNSGQEKYGNAL